MQSYFTGIWKNIVGPNSQQSEVIPNNPINSLDQSNQNEEEKEEYINENLPLELELENNSISLLKEYEKKTFLVPEVIKISPDECAKNIKISFEEENLDLKTISQIFERSIDLVKKDYVFLELKNRKERRKVFFENKKLYSEFIIGFLEETENVISKAYDNLCQALNISKEMFEKSCVLQMEKGFFQEIFTYQAKVRQSLKRSIPKTQNKGPFEVKTVLRYQINILKQKTKDFDFLIEGLKGDVDTVQMIPLGINLILSDLIYDKFGIEEEELLNLEQDFVVLSKDVELHELLMNSELAFQKILAEKGIMAGMTQEKMGGYEP